MWKQWSRLGSVCGCRAAASHSSAIPNLWKPSQNCFMCFNFTKMAPEIKVQTFFYIFLEVMFFFSFFGQVMGNLNKNSAWSASIWKNAPKMKWNAVVFLEVIFFGVFSGNFGEIWAKILRTPKNLPALTPMSLHKQRRIFIFGAPGYFKLGPFWKVRDDWCHTNHHYTCSLLSLNKLFQSITFITILLYSEFPRYPEQKQS